MPSYMRSKFSLVAAVLAIAGPASADPNDWVNVNYVVRETKNPSPVTSGAKTSIINGAVSTAKNGPWSVTNAKGVLPPSKDAHDYLSWAPYHWPECSWCTNGRTHLAHGPGSNPPPAGGESSDPKPDTSEPYPDGGVDDTDASDAGSNMPRAFRYHHRMNKIRRRPLPANGDVLNPSKSAPADVVAKAAAILDDVVPPIVPPLDPVGILPKVATQTPATSIQEATASSGTQTSTRAVKGTPAPAQAPARTQKGGKTSCTPSPTSSLAPSATWTRCPYVTRDGQVNPDVRTLNGPDAINSAAQSILYNALAYAFQQNSAFSQSVAKFIDTFFLNPATKMNPNMNFGQVVRGPGADGQIGTFTGVLDLRGMVKIVNGVMVMKATNSPDWTPARDNAMAAWMSSYTGWLMNSDIGKSTASKANNHLTFYVSQLAASNMLRKANGQVASTLQYFVDHAFKDQIAASGEQPFEAVRTRPYHYRCFNLEALIANAKMGDQVGLNLWAATSRYGATIQTALDFVMARNPGKEDVNEVLPHVASVMAAYGDPTGKYAAFLKKNMPNYQNKPFWFYDQTAALDNSPAAKKTNKRSVISARDELSGDMPEIPFQCPDVFNDADVVELDDGVFVTCDQLKPFYELLPSAAGS